MAYQPSLGDRIKRVFDYHRLRLKFLGAKFFGFEYVPQRNRISIEPSGYCNLACKFCAYRKKEFGHVIMPNEDFANYVDQATELGYREITLTSNSGEIFFDKNAAWKLDYLNSHPLVDNYYFHTNLVLPDAKMIEKL
ncbi:MAG: radical SAM protein, partial [Rhodospirillales bacterium]|nr:radical SAM protein [Rhodospirillales bacterium]